MFHSGSRKQRGQSLPLLAIMLLVIVALIGLSVDVGNAYGQQRRVQNVANAGALAGMNSVVRFQSNQDVCTSVQRTLAANGIAKDDPDYTYRVDYVLEANGGVVMVCEWTGVGFHYNRDLAMNQTRPANIKRVQVTISETVDTYFARAVGQNDLTVNANGNACLGGYGPGTYPIGVPLRLDRTVPDNQGVQHPYHRVIRANGTELPTTDPVWGNWSEMMGMTILLPFSNDPNTPGTHISWLDWDAGNSDAKELQDALTYPGTLENGFKEGTPISGGKNVDPAGEFQLDDWIEGKTGVVASVSGELHALMNPPGGGEPRDLILPMYSAGHGQGSNSGYHITAMGYFRLVGFNLTGQGSSGFGVAPPSPIIYDKYLMLRYMGVASGSPQECASETPDAPDSPKRYQIAGLTKLTRVYSEMVRTDKGVSYDILLVMDVSTSMRRDWENHTNNPNRARINDAKAALNGFLHSYNVQADPESRIAFVSFGGEGTSGNIVTEQNWSTACVNPADNCGGATNKWRPIQDRINSYNHNNLREGTPGPQTFERALQLLQNKRTPSGGKRYEQIVIFATDGVFNVCGTERGTNNCPVGSNVGSNVQTNQLSGMPIWQAQQVANRIKSTTGARIFMVSIIPNCSNPDPVEGCFNTTGLPEMSSGSGHYFSARDSAALVKTYDDMRKELEKVDTTWHCVPGEKQAGAEGAQMVLTQPNNPTFMQTKTADNTGQWKFDSLQAGEYVVKVDPSYAMRSTEDNTWRTYSRVRNALNLNEETQASVYINPQFPNGATVYSELHLSLPLAADEAPQNGCSTRPSP